jgi:hypothetical protein
MSIEQIDNSNEENGLPYTVEKIENIHRPEVEINAEGQLIIDGKIEEKYSRVDRSSKRTQKNNPNIVYFNAMDAGDDYKTNAGRIIDITNPEQELLQIKKNDKEDILVNGVEWNALKGKKVYFGGYRVEIDSEGQKIVFAETGHEKQSVIVNNAEWNTKFNGITTASSKYGIPYAIESNGKLVIDDKEWIYPTVTEEEKNNSRYSYEQSVSDVAIGKNREVAAAIRTIRDNVLSSYIFVGDTQGAKSQWQESMDSVKNIVIDENTGTVAVFGEKVNHSKKMEIIINDIPYQMDEHPEALDYFGFEDGALIAQYTDAMGQKVTEKITLKEGSKELQVLREKKDSEENALTELRAMIAKENIPLSEIMNRLSAGKDLEKTMEENDTLYDRVSELETNKLKLEQEIKDVKKQYEQQITDAQAKAEKAQSALATIESVLKNAGKVTLSSNSKLTPEEMDSALNAIKNAK